MGRKPITPELKRERLGPYTLPGILLDKLNILRHQTGLMESELIERAVLEQYELDQAVGQEYPRVEILVDKGPFQAGDVVNIYSYRHRPKIYVVKGSDGNLWEFSGWPKKTREAREVNSP